MSQQSESDLLILHAVRLLGFADTPAVAVRAGADRELTRRTLQAAENAGWVQHLAFADLGGWSLTEAGKGENERRLAIERSRADPHDAIAGVYPDFLPLNARLVRAVTDWQIRPTGADRLAPNDHSDPTWDGDVLDELAAIGAALETLEERLSGVLHRFGGYAARYELALRQARSGRIDRVDRSDVDSCHRVWFQLHEDLIATLGIDRGADARSQ